MQTHTFEHHVAFAPKRASAAKSVSHSWLTVAPVLVVTLTVASYRAAAPAATIVPVASSVSSLAPGLVTSFGARHSHNGRYFGEVVSHSPVAIGVTQSWTIHLAQRAHRLAHASVTARVWMPETAERSPTVPTIHYVGHGDYRIDGLSFSRSGWWNVALVIEAGRGTDSVAFNLIIPAANDHRVSAH